MPIPREYPPVWPKAFLRQPYLFIDMNSAVDGTESVDFTIELPFAKLAVGYEGGEYGERHNDGDALHAAIAHAAPFPERNS